MTGKDIVDLAAAIVNRQEAGTRGDLVTFINSARLNVLRSMKINRLLDYRAVVHTGGVIDVEAQRIKAVRLVEYDGGPARSALKAVYSR